MQENEEIILSDLSERFLQAMNYREVTGYQLKKDGVINNESTLTKIKQGKQKPSPKTIDSFCEIYLIDRSWMYTGEGDMDPKVRAEKINKGTVEPIAFYEDKEDDKDCLNHSNSIVIKPNKGEMLNTTLTTEKIESKGVPYFDDIECTGGILSMYNDMQEKPTFNIDYEHFNDCTAYIPIVGDSMYPQYCSGEIIAVKKINNLDALLWGEAYLVVTNSNANDLRTVKLLFQSDDSTKIILRASNPNYKGDTIINKEDIISLFIIKGKIKRNQL